jgi:hypothetical protein
MCNWFGPGLGHLIHVSNLRLFVSELRLTYETAGHRRAVQVRLEHKPFAHGAMPPILQLIIPRRACRFWTYRDQPSVA